MASAMPAKSPVKMTMPREPTPSRSICSIVSLPGQGRRTSAAIVRPANTERSWTSPTKTLTRSAGDTHHHQSRLGHRLHRIAHALAPQPRILDPAVRHLIDPEHRIVVDDHAAYLQPGERPEDPVNLRGEDAGLQSVGRLVDHRDRRLH